MKISFFVNLSTNPQASPAHLILLGVIFSAKEGFYNISGLFVIF